MFGRDGVTRYLVYDLGEIPCPGEEWIPRPRRAGTLHDLPEGAREYAWGEDLHPIVFQWTAEGRVYRAIAEDALAGPRSPP